MMSLRLWAERSTTAAMVGPAPQPQPHNTSMSVSLSQCESHPESWNMLQESYGAEVSKQLAVLENIKPMSPSNKVINVKFGNGGGSNRKRCEMRFVAPQAMVAVLQNSFDHENLVSPKKAVQRFFSF